MQPIEKTANAITDFLALLSLVALNDGIGLTIWEVAPGPNGRGGLIRMNFREYKKALEKWQWLIFEALGRARPRFERVFIHIIRYHTGDGMDRDNLNAAAKIPIDALRKCGVIPDDTDEHVAGLLCTKERVGRRQEQRTEILLYPIKAAPDVRNMQLIKARTIANGKPGSR